VTMIAMSTTELKPGDGSGRRGPDRTSLALAARVGLDVLWFVPGLGPLATAALLAGLGTRLTHLTRLVRPPWIAIAWIVWVGIAVLRDPGSPWSWIFAGHYVGPLIVIAAVRTGPADLLRTGLVAWLGVLALAALKGSSGLLVLHGWPRLVGAHGNLHTLAAGLAVVAPTAIAFAAAASHARDRRLGGVVAVVASLALGLTFVRTAWIWALVSGLVALLVLRRPRWAALVAGLGGGLALASGRFATLIAAALGQAPAGGWNELGSSRLEIWQHTVQDWLALDATTRWCGAGLGRHLGVYRHFDPHSEVLALGWQLGLGGLGLGLGLWCAVGLALWRRALRQPGPWTAIALGLWVGATVTAPLSNDLVTRTTASWWMAACWGAALAASPAPGRPRPRPA